MPALDEAGSSLEGQCHKPNTGSGISDHAESPSKNSPRLQFLDALRGWAIAGVMLVHSAQIVDLPSHWVYYVREGARGVELFYLVSAFTLCYVTRHVHGCEPWWPNFYVRRFFRIAPMYYVVAFVSVLIYAVGSPHGPWHKVISFHTYWSGGSSGLTAGNVIANLLFVHGFNPYWITSIVPGGWSIAVEASFYALFPLLFRLGRTPLRALCLFIGSTVLACMLPRWASDLDFIKSHYLWGHYLYFWFPNQLPIFCLGILLFHFSQWVDQRFHGSRIRLGVLCTIAGCLALVCLVAMGRISFVRWHILVGIACSLIVAGLITHPLALFVNNTLIKLGRISYSCYLWHIFAVSLVAYANNMAYRPLHDLPPLWGLVATYASVVALTCLISRTTWKYVEETGIRFGKVVTGQAFTGPRVMNLREEKEIDHQDTRTPRGPGS